MLNRPRYEILDADRQVDEWVRMMILNGSKTPKHVLTFSKTAENCIIRSLGGVATNHDQDMYEHTDFFLEDYRVNVKSRISASELFQVSTAFCMHVRDNQPYDLLTMFVDKAGNNHIEIFSVCRAVDLIQRAVGQVHMMPSGSYGRNVNENWIQENNLLAV